METQSGGGSRLASILAVQGASNAIHGARNDAERVFRHRLYRLFRIERELLADLHESKIPLPGLPGRGLCRRGLFEGT
jgi:hypothetical protein